MSSKKKFAEKEAFKNRGTRKLARGLSKEALEYAKSIFYELDLNRDGLIDRREMQAALYAPSELHKIVTVMGLMDADINKDGRIDFNEFLEFIKACSEMPTDSDFKAMWYMINESRSKGDWKLSVRELQSGFAKFGVYVSEDDIQILMAIFDRNRDGEISFDEFKAIMGGFI